MAAASAVNTEDGGLNSVVGTKGALRDEHGSSSGCGHSRTPQK
jgi:hypothetical protein